jgi:acyl carrier protein
MKVLLNDVATILAEVAECDIEEVQLDTNLSDELGISSLMGLEVLVMLERKYNLKLDEEVLLKMTTPRNIMDILIENLGQEEETYAVSESLSE